LGKVTILLDDELEKDLRKYIAEFYPEETYGKLSMIMNEALKHWLMK